MNTEPSKVIDQSSGHIIIIIDNNSDVVGDLTSILADNQLEFATLACNKIDIGDIGHLQPDVIIIEPASLGSRFSETCQMLRNDINTNQIPLLFINPSNNETDRTNGFEAGCTDYILSPFQSFETLSRIRTHISLSQTRKELKKNNLLMREQSNQLTATKKELASFSYSISHDLRAPLRSIAGFSSIVREDYTQVLDDEGQNYLLKIENGVFRMRSLIDDLLKLSKITRKDINRKSVNLTEIAQKISSKIEIDISNDLVANCDEELVEILLSCLFDNAEKFSRKCDQAIITFGTKNLNGNDIFFIKDNGIGFDMALAEKLFKPFQKLVANEEYEGTGIGLATVQRVINMHGGEVWVESKIDNGTTFYFVFA